MKAGSTRSITSRSQPPIATIRHRPVIRTADFGTPLVMGRQSKPSRGDWFGRGDQTDQESRSALIGPRLA